MITVCLVDDHKILREGLKRILESDNDISIAAEVESVSELVSREEGGSWDVVVLDVSHPGKNGLQNLKDIKLHNPNVPVLILSMYDMDLYGIRLIRADAAGFLTKETAPDELKKAIRHVASGKKYISPRFAELLASSISDESQLPSHEMLSDREFEVLKMIGAGRSLTDISRHLRLSIKTISTYRSRILDKLGFENNSDIVRYCMQNQLIE